MWILASRIAINNMPISRFLEWLQNTDNLETYMEVLVNAFNPGNIAGLMAKRDIDGGLVGGASLDPDTFASVIRYWV